MSDVGAAVRALATRQVRVESASLATVAALKDLAEYTKEREAIEREMANKLEATAKKWVPWHCV